MVKLSYETQIYPDRDDKELAQAISEGTVPPRCVTLGVLIKERQQQGYDPCAPCQIDRERCGGRERDKSLGPEEYLDNSESGAASVRRRLQKRALSAGMESLK